MDNRLVIMFREARAQVGATEKLLRLNQKTLDDAEAMIEIYKHDARATKDITAACKRLRFIRSNHKRAKSKRPN